MHKHTINQVVSELRNAAYMSAGITFILILIEVPIVIAYVFVRFMFTFILSITILALWHIILMLWNKVTSSKQEATT